MNKPLNGIKVVEVSTFIAVPACASFLADFGAIVIKIESKEGDPVRFTGTSEGRVDSPYENTTFDLENARKRGIVLDLKSAKGKEILFKLLESADVFLTNLQPILLRSLAWIMRALERGFPELFMVRLPVMEKQALIATSLDMILQPFGPGAVLWAPYPRRIWSL